MKVGKLFLTIDAKNAGLINKTFCKNKRKKAINAEQCIFPLFNNQCVSTFLGFWPLKIQQALIQCSRKFKFFVNNSKITGEI